MNQPSTSLCIFLASALTILPLDSLLYIRVCPVPWAQIWTLRSWYSLTSSEQDQCVALLLHFTHTAAKLGVGLHQFCCPGALLLHGNLLPLHGISTEMLFGWIILLWGQRSRQFSIHFTIHLSPYLTNLIRRKLGEIVLKVLLRSAATALFLSTAGYLITESNWAGRAGFVLGKPMLALPSYLLC